MSSAKQSSTIYARRRLWLAVLLTVASAFSLFWLWPGESAERLLLRALSTQEPADRIHLLQRAIRANHGDYAAAQIQLAISLARRKDWQEVALEIDRLNCDASVTEDLFSLAELSITSEAWGPAEKILASLEKLEVSARRMTVLKCHVYRGQGRVAELLSSAESLTNIAPDEAEYWQLLAEIHEQLENQSAAIQTYIKALSHSLPAKDSISMTSRLVDHAIDVGDIALANKYLDKLRQLGVQKVQMEIMAARLAQLEGDPKRALKLLDVVMSEVENHPQALRLRGILHYELGELAEAHADLAKSHDRDPEDEIVLYKLAEINRRFAQLHHNDEYAKRAKEYQGRYVELHRQDKSRRDFRNRLPSP